MDDDKAENTHYTVVRKDAADGSPAITAQYKQLRESKFKDVFTRALNLVGDDEGAGSARTANVTVSPTTNPEPISTRSPTALNAGGAFRPYPSLAPIRVTPISTQGGVDVKGQLRQGAQASAGETLGGKPSAVTPPSATAETSVAATAHAAMLRAQARTLGIGTDPADWEVLREAVTAKVGGQVIDRPELFGPPVTDANASVSADAGGTAHSKAPSVRSGSAAGSGATTPGSSVSGYAAGSSRGTPRAHPRDSGYAGEDETASVRNRGSVNRPKLRSSEPLPYSSAVTPAPTSPPQSVPAQATQPPAGSAPAGDRPGNWVGWGGLSGAQGGLGGVGGGAGWRPIAELTASANQLLDAALAKARGAVKLPDANSPGVDGSLACGLPGFAQAHAQAKAMLDEARRMAEAALMEALARSNGSELNQQKQRLLELELKLSEAEEKLAMMGSMAGTPRSGRSGGGGGGGGSRMSTTPSVLSGYIHRDRARSVASTSASTVNHGAHGLPVGAESPMVASTAATSPTASAGAATPLEGGAGRNLFVPPVMSGVAADTEGGATDLSQVAVQLQREKERQKHVRAQARRTAAQLQSVTQALAEHEEQVHGAKVNLEEIEADARKMLAGHSSAFREARRRGKEDEGGGPGGTAVAGAREGPEWRGAGLPPLDSPTDTAADTPRSSVTPEPGASRASTAQSYRPGTHLRERFLQKASEAAALLGDDDFGATGFVDAASVEERLDELRRRRAELEQESRAADGAQDGGDGTGAETAGWSVQGDSPASEAGRPLSRPGDSTPNWDTQSYSSAGGSQYEPYRHPSASAPPARQVSAIGSIETDIPHLTTEEARLIMDARAAKEAAVRRAIAAMRAAEEEAERSRVAVARREMAVAEAAADATPLFAATRDAAERAMRQEQDGDRRRSAPVTDASGALLPRKKKDPVQRAPRTVLNVSAELETSLIMGKPPSEIAKFVSSGEWQPDGTGSADPNSIQSVMNEMDGARGRAGGHVEARARIAEMYLSGQSGPGGALRAQEEAERAAEEAVFQKPSQTPLPPLHMSGGPFAQQQPQQDSKDWQENIQHSGGSKEGSGNPTWRPPMHFEGVASALQRSVFRGGERPPATANVTDEMLKRLASHTTGDMAVLDVSGCKGVSPNSVLEVARANEGLVSVLAAGGQRWTVESISNLQAICYSLEVLEVDVKAPVISTALLNLFHSPVVRVRRLEIGGPLRADAAGILAGILQAAPHLGSVHFSACSFHPRVLPGALSGAVQSLTIRILELEGCGLTEDAAEDIASALSAKLTLQALSVRDNAMGDAGTKRIAEAVAVHPALLLLDVGYNRISPKGAACLVDMVCRAPALRALIADGNKLGDDGINALADSLRSSNILEELELGRNHVGVDDSRGNYQQGRGARALAGALRISRSIRRLGLAGNILGDAGARMLSVALRSNSSLASLDVRSTGITGLGALELAEVLDRDACSLVELRMGGNLIDDGAKQDILGYTRKNASISFDDDAE